MDVFVYRTLLDPHQALRVVPDATFGPDATLEGLHAVEGRYPTLAPGGSVAGQLLSTDRVDALDAYEGVDEGRYVRVELPNANGGTVAAYVGDPDRLDSGASIEWPGEGPLGERVARYVEREGVVVRPE
jgi:gamma-glutamylaminecyclotransferase